MPRRSAEAVQLPEQEPREEEVREASKHTSSEQPAGVAYSDTYVADAARRLEDLKETAEWEIDGEAAENIKAEIRDLEQFVARHERKPTQKRKPELRVIPGGVGEKSKKPAAPREERIHKPSVFELRTTIKELEAQRATISARLPEAAMQTGQTAIVKEQITTINHEIAELQARIKDMMARAKRSVGPDITPEQRLERMGRSFEITRERQATSARRRTEKHERALEESDAERQQALRKIEAAQSGLAENETEAEFFAADDEEAAIRAEGMQVLKGEGLSPAAAAREWKKMVKLAPKSSTESRQRIIDFVNYLRSQGQVDFSGEEYFKALQPFERPGFFARLFGAESAAKERRRRMEEALENLPNVGKLYGKFEGSNRKRRGGGAGFRGVKGR